jgi:hypothetical protein
MQEYAESSDWITDAVSSAVGLPRRQVAMVSWDGQAVAALALMTRVRNSLTLKASFRLTDFRDLEPISFAQLLAHLSEPHRTYLKGAMSRGGSLPSITATELKRYLQGGDEDGPWTELEKMTTFNPQLLWREDRTPVVAFEREAIGLALGLADFDRRQVMSTWSGNADTPFLTSLGAFRLLERQILAREARVFGDWTVIADGLVGATQFEQRGRKLTVINVNESKIEHSLGCDLIYYVHDYDAYVLVQYKRLKKSGDGWEYRPDKQLPGELRRMRRLTRSATGSTDPRAHRLGDDFCFLKLCKPEVDDPFSQEMAEGMYLPLGLWDKLVGSGQVLGPRGGTVVTYENVGRHLSNTHFVNLVERAWVGSRNLTSGEVSTIIKEALRAGGSLILATGDSPSPRRRMARPR